MDPRGNSDTVEPVEAYLDELFDRLAGTGRAGRWALAEAEDHLLSLVDEEKARGAGELDSARAAVARFGDPALVAAGFHKRITGPRAFVCGLASGAWLFAAIAASAIGATGLLSVLLLRVVPRWFDARDVQHPVEAVGDRLLIGLAGLAALAIFHAARRRGPLRRHAFAAPVGALAAFTAVAAGLVGLWLTVDVAARVSLHTAAQTNAGEGLSIAFVLLFLSAGASVVGVRRVL